MILKLKDITYFNDNTDIINNINLEINEGDCISLIGPSGSGKSTLLKILSDLISPTKGNIFFKEKNYTEYEPTQLRKKISYCIQTPHLFGDTVYDNVSYPFIIRKEEICEKTILKFMEKFNLDSNYLYKSVNSLSGGEKQRVALIRNLMFKPDILLLDEVTSALDKENSIIVQNYIKELNSQGVTIIWVTHNIKQSSSIFNKRISMEQGNIINKEDLI
ncbi:MAG: ABC transporter ATP-binding protein [Romboutsia sp.]|uniref:ABC transporter ATP-binding protein n=1 Tax=Romboutsia sp. TaxID=1965302 RepID=UPI003F38FF12